ncbi:MAG: hypothetical protein RH942_07490 [Kiloniellaceae bacterium]
MTAIPRLQLLPAPGTSSGARAVAAADRSEQQVRPVLAAKSVRLNDQQSREIYDPQRPGSERSTTERRVGDRRIGDRQTGQSDVPSSRQPRQAETAASGRLIGFSRLTSMPFMVQLLGQQDHSRASAAAPQTSLTGHRDAAQLGSDVYRRSGGEPEFLPEAATFVRLVI